MGEIDYRCLLIKYMYIVMDNDGTTFVENSPQGKCTPEEHKALLVIEREVEAEYHGDHRPK